MESTRATKFEAVAKAIEGRVSIVVTQIDPDALASAFGLAHALEAVRGVNGTQVVTCGPVAHPQNRAIINRFNLRERMTDIAELDRTTVTALVDSSCSEDGRLPNGVALNPRIVIDHHRGADVVEATDTFVWIDEVGSASTLVVELLGAVGVTPDDKELEDLGPLLALGIYTDTHALVSATQRDHAAYAWAARATSTAELQRLIEYPLPDTYYANLAYALNHVEQRGPRLVASAGTINPADGDDLATIADFFLRKEGINMAAVWAMCGSGIRLSARNSNLSVPLDEFLAERFGPSSGAKLSPCGHGEGGAFVQLELGPWMSEGNKEEVEAMVSKRIQEWIFGDS